MKKITTLLSIAVLIVSAIFYVPAKSYATVTSDWPKGPSVSAESAIVMDATTGLVLYEKNSHKHLYPASITKIMTTLLAIEHSNLSDVVTFSKDAIYNMEPDASHIGTLVGEQLTVEQSLYAIMLASANEVSNGIAEHVSGSVAKFADLMNQRAKELGCTDTNFVNPNGLHNDNHYTSAYDMALISRAAIQNSTFRTVTGTKRYTIPPTNLMEEARPMSNHHQMLVGIKQPQYKYEYCIGGKTGYTSKAKNTLVTFAKKGDLELICVVLKSQPSSQPQNLYTDTIDLLNFGFENFTTYPIHETTSPLELNETQLFTKYNPLFNTDASPLSISSSGLIVLPNQVKLEDTKKEVILKKRDPLTNIIGSITYQYNGITVGSADILYKETNMEKLDTKAVLLEEASKASPLSNLLDKTGENGFLNPLSILGIISIIVALLTVLYIILRRRRVQFFTSRRRTRRRRARNYRKYY